MPGRCSGLHCGRVPGFDARAETGIAVPNPTGMIGGNCCTYGRYISAR